MGEGRGRPNYVNGSPLQVSPQAGATHGTAHIGFSSPARGLPARGPSGPTYGKAAPCRPECSAHRTRPRTLGASSGPCLKVCSPRTGGATSPLRPLCHQQVPQPRQQASSWTRRTRSFAQRAHKTSRHAIQIGDACALAGGRRSGSRVEAGGYTSLRGACPAPGSAMGRGCLLHARLAAALRPPSRRA